MAKILIVEDDASFAEALKVRIQSNGFEVAVAATLEEGLDSIDRDRPDLILVDLVLPAMNGQTMVEELRRKGTAGEVPIIIMTGREHMKELDALRGVRDFVIKPFDGDELTLRIQWNLRNETEGKEKAAKGVPTVASKEIAETAPITHEPRNDESVPAAPSEEAGQPAGGGGATHETSDKSKTATDAKKILLVDDDAELVETLKVRLSAERFEVHTATNGEEALSVTRQAHPDIIVMDVMMPKLDGFSTLKQINQLSEKKIPVVVITGTPIVTEEEFRIEGARAFMRKPVDGAELVKNIREILT